MKNSWLYSSLVVLTLVWSSFISFYFSLFLLLMAFIYYVRRYTIHPIFFLILGVCAVRILLPLPTTIPKDKIVQIQEIKNGYAIADTGKEQVVLYQAKDIGLQDVISLKGEYIPVDTVHNFRMFTFSQWLNRRKIFYQMKVKSYTLIRKGSGIRRGVYDKVDSIADENTKDFVKGMLYGIHDEDVSFFMTSSGLHISYLFQILQNLLTQFLTTTVASVICLFGIGSLAYATVLSSSLLRILCFRMVSLTCKNCSPADRLGISILITLMLAPYMAYELALLLPLVFRLASLFRRQRISRQLLSLLVLLPFQYLFFHMVNPIQLFLFRVYRPVYAFLYALCLLAVVLPLHITMITDFLVSTLDQLQSIGVVWYYTPQLWWLIAWVLYSIRLLTYEKKTTLMFLFLLLLYAPYASYFNPFAEVLMLDVGQGDCALIILPYHQGTMLIDVMGSRFKNIPKDIIVPVLKAKGIHSIDHVVLTHEDYDHSGGLKELQELVEVKDVITDKRSDMMLNDLHIPFLLSTYKGKDANDSSIVTYFELHDTSVLFMGDAGIAAEEQILKDYPNLQADILKAGHHGSRTSSSPEFLHQVHPSLALISSGRGNRYGHPHPEPLQTMKEEGIHPLITARNGAVSIRISKYFSYYVSADHEIGLLDVHSLW